MRHLGSLLAALIIGPAAWILLASGQTDLRPAGADSRWLEKVAFLAVAGLLVGLIATVRISPLGPVVAGVVYAGYGIAALWRRDVYDVLPDTLTVDNRRVALHAPVLNGTAIVLGVLLLTAIISVRRWQRWPRPAPTAAEPAPAPAHAGGVTPAAAAAAGVAATGVRPSPRHAAPDEDHEGTGEPAVTGDSEAADFEAAHRAEESEAGWPPPLRSEPAEGPTEAVGEPAPESVAPESVAPESAAPEEPAAEDVTEDVTERVAEPAAEPTAAEPTHAAESEHEGKPEQAEGAPQAEPATEPERVAQAEPTPGDAGGEPEPTAPSDAPGSEPTAAEAAPKTTEPEATAEPERTAEPEITSVEPETTRPAPEEPPAAERRLGVSPWAAPPRQSQR
jgi:hypothetical protein